MCPACIITIGGGLLLAEKLGFTYFSYCQVSHLKHQHLGTGILHNFPDAQVYTEKNEVSLHSLAW